MAIGDKIYWTTIDKLHLDPKNPRLGRDFAAQRPSQNEILERMKGWSLEELAVSFLESGFWPQEALVVVEERVGNSKQLVVVEGNRRLAALVLLGKARAGKGISRKWREIAETGSDKAFGTLERLPYVKADSRKDVQAYLGFRHVSGIKEWDPPEKAQFIAHLIDDEGLSYAEVMRRIGSKTPTVRQNYISYRLLLQMEGEREDIAIKQVEERFSVLYLSLRTTGVQKYLQIDILADPRKARRPVPKSKLEQLAKFALWLFGDEQRKPIVKDSRDVDNFGKVLESKKAVSYLERTETPTFEAAYRIAGGDEIETAKRVETAADEVEQALGTAHLHKRSRRLEQAAERLGYDVMQLLELFPEAKSKVLSE